MEMKKESIQSIILLGIVWVGLYGLTGCRTRQAGQITLGNATERPLVPDGNWQVPVDVTFRVPADYFTKRSRLVITPQLMINDSLRAEYTPLVLDADIYAKKKYRLEVLEDYKDPYRESALLVEDTHRAIEIPYRTTLDLPAGTREATLRAVISTDGCGECTGIDTLSVVEIEDPLNRLRPTMRHVEPKFVVREKIRQGEGKAHLQFLINRYDIDPSLGNNRAEMEQMRAALQPVLTDSLATLNALSITGVASADGSLALNTALARQRAESAKAWLTEQFDLPTAVERRISVNSRPEGWEPVLKAMLAANDPDAPELAKLLERYADQPEDTQERHIRRSPFWQNIKEHYLQGDRVVEYRCDYTLRSFTSDEEMLALYATRPDAFNEEELLRVSALVDSADERMVVYQTTLRYYPSSAIAANNLALLYWEQGDEAEAERLWSKVADSLTEARYNLGMLKALQRQIDEAARLLEPFDDENARLVKSLITKE